MKAWMKPARQLALVASAVAAAAMMAGPPLTLAGPALTAGTHAQRVPQGLGGKVWSIIPTHAKVVGLTFDVGSNADGVASILHTLSTQRVAASFFVTGNFVNAYAAQAKAMAAAGRIGDHSIFTPGFRHRESSADRYADPPAGARGAADDQNGDRS
jgi:peptidoglycan/xylan/chitin deacetylase (PgdA/CDA1 family)